METKNISAADTQIKNIFVFDKNKCVGCQACSVACMIENGIQKGDRWRNIYASNMLHLPGLPLYYTSLACNHCDDAPCMKNCPANAFYRDELSGAVIHQNEKCIGCKYCTWACPFDAPKFDSKKGVVEKCTFCQHRIANDQKPACALHCPTGALNYESVAFTRLESDQSSPVPVKIGARIKVKALRNHKGPMQDLDLFGSEQKVASINPNKGKISAIKEWSLLVFSLLLAWTVALQTSEVFGHQHGFIKYLNLILVGLAAFVSFLHLGNKKLAWRAVLNIRNSWLSREILLLTALMALLVVHIFITQVSTFAFMVLGILLLFAVDKIYDLAKWHWKMPLHDAQALFIGLSVYFFLKGFIVAFMVIISIRMLLVIFHSLFLRKQGLIFSLFRLVLMLAVLILAYFSNQVLWIGLLLFASEIFNRIDFYNKLSVTNPQNDLC